ncbi:hypothetical protein AB0C96_15710 [Streptomyces sp. NPDC048506]|uniref:hypothetical protein n=1 Tax=Streptomyces sp. NPDC048506 TaxID=3155028 RepID=UPI00342D8AE6
MFSRKQIAVVSGLLGGLVVAFTGSAQAYPGGTATNCTRDIQGNLTCQQRNVDSAGEDGRYNLHQTQDCLAMKPVSWPSSGLLNNGATQIGPSVTCSNTAPAPGSQLPHMVGEPQR